MEVSLGVALKLREAKGTDVQELSDCSFDCKMGLLLLLLPEC